MGRNSHLYTGIEESRGPDGSVQLDLESVTAAAAADFHNRTGGSSFYVDGGNRAAHGWAVGGMQGVPESHGSDPMTPEEYQAHRDSVRLAMDDTTGVMAGTWKEAGRSVMDASEVAQTRDKARDLQIARGERAVYNLHEGREEDLR